MSVSPDGTAFSDRVFSDFVDVLAAGERPTVEQQKMVLEALKTFLISELRRRGLWTRPPQFVGVVGSSSWDRTALEELTQSAYEHVFVDRLDGLVRARGRGRMIEGAVRRSVSQMVAKRQSRRDPIGRRVYGLLLETLEPMVESGRLVVVDPDVDAGVEASGRSDRIRLHKPTVLCFERPTGERAASAIPEELIHAWVDDLLEELAVGWRRRPVIEELEHRIDALRSVADCFRFVDVLDPLRTETRRRYTARMHETLGGESAPAEGPVVLERRQIAETLRRCIARRIDEERMPRRRERLGRLFRALRLWAQISDDETKPPSNSRLADLLDSRKNTVQTDRKRLQSIAAACRSEASGGRGGGEEEPEAGGGGHGAMNSEDERVRARREELLQRSVEAAARVGRIHASPAALEPGSLVLLPNLATESSLRGDVSEDVEEPEPADDGVEWLIARLDERGAEIVPVDVAPWQGTRDLPLAGELEHHVVRGAVARRVSAASLRDVDVVGRVDEPQLATVRGFLDDPEGRAPGHSPTLAAEDDHDPEYREWIERLERVIRELERRPGETVPESGAPPATDASLGEPDAARVLSFERVRPSRAFDWALAATAAAVLLSVGVGPTVMEWRRLADERERTIEKLTARTGALEQEIDQLTESWVAPLDEPVFRVGETVRGGDFIEIESGSLPRHRIAIAFGRDADRVGTRVRIVDSAGEVIAESELVVDPYDPGVAVSLSDRRTPPGARLEVQWIRDDEVLDSISVLVR